MQINEKFPNTLYLTKLLSNVREWYYYTIFFRPGISLYLFVQTIYQVSNWVLILTPLKLAPFLYCYCLCL